MSFLLPSFPHPSPVTDKTELCTVVAGWDSVGGAQVYNIPVGGGYHKLPFTLGGSGSTYVYGHCDQNWKEDMTRDEAEAFVKSAISLAMARDGSSGGIIRLAHISPDAETAERDVLAGADLPQLNFTG